MAKFEVKRHGGGLVAEFDTHDEAIAYVQGKDDPSIYVAIEAPKEPIKQEPPSRLEMWWVESMETKWWFRYLNAIALVVAGFFIAELTQGEVLDWLGKAVMFIGALMAYELLALGVVVFLANMFFGDSGFISTPIAIIIGACIIAFAIYQKKK